MPLRRVGYPRCMTSTPSEAGLPDELPEESAPAVGPDDNSPEDPRDQGDPDAPGPDLDEDELPG